MKKLLAVITVSALMLGLAGCQSQEPDVQEPEVEDAEISEDVSDDSDDEEVEKEPEAIGLGEQVEVSTGYGDFLLTVEDVKKSDWVERMGEDSENSVAVLVECDVENISYEDPDNDFFWLDIYLTATDDEGYVVSTLSYGYDDGLYSTTLEIPAGSKGRIVVAYNCGVDIESMKININGQYVLNAPLKDEKGLTQLAYEAATDLTLDDLSKTSIGGYAYEGLVISDSELSSIEDGTLYRAMAQQLEGFYIFKDETYSMWGSTVVKTVFGFEKPDTWAELKPYVDETKKLIARTQSLGNLMSIFESLSVTEGTFDYVGGEFSFAINDLTGAAEELGITETALGYILAYLNEYASTTTFDGNSCQTDVKWYGAERTADASIYSVYEDFALNDIKEFLVSEDFDFFCYITTDGVNDDDFYDVCTKKGIRLGESSDAVIFEYGGELLPYDKSDDIIYYAGVEWDDPVNTPQFDLYKYYIIYTVEGYGNVVFYFNEDKELYMIDFCNDVFY